MLVQEYEVLDRNNWEPKIKECCDLSTQDDPGGCDCCYDKWRIELKEVNTKYSAAVEAASQLKSQLAVITDRRDKLKNWYDELTKVNELARQLCDQLDIILTQSKKIAINSSLTVEAIKKLYCMFRDFYMQIDLIKTKYDRLINCIKCLNNPALAPGQGIMKALEEYGKKLEIVIATRDAIIKALMEVMAIACRIKNNIEENYGLVTVIKAWKVVFKCWISCKDNNGPCDDDEEEEENEKHTDEEEGENCLGSCKLDPVFIFPICKDDYYKCLDDMYLADKAAAEKLNEDLLKENKKKESLLACKQSLEAAIKEVDPKILCK